MRCDPAKGGAFRLPTTPRRGRRRLPWARRARNTSRCGTAAGWRSTSISRKALAASDAPRSKLPTILILTPYYRRFKLRPGAPATTEPSPNAGKWRDLFVPRGYAVVVCDVRGTGASFGMRDSFRSPAEREDYREIADWIVRQAWSDGSIGATGISYVGAAADFLASTGHPAVKAIAPLFAVWDTYSDHYYPGGLLLNRLAETYDELMIALDQDRRDLLGKFAYFKDPNFDGPQPVDDDPEGRLARAAVAEHQNNFRMTEFIREFRFKDDALASDPAVTPASFSPYGYCADVRPDVAVYSVSGWYDGAGYANGGIARFLTLPNPKRHLLLGPWDHGARVNGSPWRAQPEPEFPLLGEVLRFFDQYLMGLATGLDREAPVHYFAMHEERWHAADTWPPPATAQSLYLAPRHSLANAPAAPASDSYATSFAFGTGSLTRYERIAALDTRDYYADWHGRDETLLVYSSEPLRQPQSLAGHALVTLWLEADQPDAAIHVVPGGGRGRRALPLCHGRHAAGAAPQDRAVPRRPQDDVAVADIRAQRRCGSPARCAGRDDLRAAPRRLGVQGRQPRAPGYRRRGSRSRRPGAARATAAPAHPSWHRAPLAPGAALPQLGWGQTPCLSSCSRTRHGWRKGSDPI